MPEPRWKIRGEFMESCNCDYLCPCIFTNSRGSVTNDYCTSLQVYRIEEGHCDDTRLDGLAFALIVRSGKIMADGNWIFAGVIDAAADDRQRTALAAIVAGEAGGPPSFIRKTLVSDFRGIAFMPIQFSITGLARSASIQGILSFAIEGVPSSVEKGQPLCIDNTEHPANRRIALARANEMSVHGFGLDDELIGRGNNGHFASFAWAA